MLTPPSSSETYALVWLKSASTCVRMPFVTVSALPEADCAVKRTVNSVPSPFRPSASWAVGSASNTEIDDWGISYALGIAALRALGQAEEKLGIDGDGMLDGKPVKVGAILDGPNDYITKALNTFDAPDVPVPAEVSTKVKGDRYCATVATAAVIAKVTRDRLMVELGAQPQYEPYEWAHNKGYGSAAHRDAIAEFGPSDLHRLSWHLV